MVQILVLYLTAGNKVQACSKHVTTQCRLFSKTAFTPGKHISLQVSLDDLHTWWRFLHSSPLCDTCCRQLCHRRQTRCAWCNGIGFAASSKYWVAKVERSYGIPPTGIPFLATKWIIITVTPLIWLPTSWPESWGTVSNDDMWHSAYPTMRQVELNARIILVLLTKAPSPLGLCFFFLLHKSSILSLSRNYVCFSWCLMLNCSDAINGFPRQYANSHGEGTL